MSWDLIIHLIVFTLIVASFILIIFCILDLKHTHPILFQIFKYKQYFHTNYSFQSIIIFFLSLFVSIVTLPLPFSISHRLFLFFFFASPFPYCIFLSLYYRIFFFFWPLNMFWAFVGFFLTYKCLFSAFIILIKVLQMKASKNAPRREDNWKRYPYLFNQCKNLVFEC